MGILKNEKIILDSCILFYCELYDFKLEIRKILRSLADNNNRLGISELSGFEVLKNAEAKNKKYFVSLLNFLKNLPLSKDAIINSIILYKSYKRKSVSRVDKINTCDYLIGGTVLSYKNALLFTSNRKDFPKPLWDIVRHDYINYKTDEKWEILNLYILKPNLSIITP